MLISLNKRINKLMAVFHASVSLLIMNFVKTFSISCFDNVVMKFIVNNGADTFMTGQKICALQVPPVVPYKALGNFPIHNVPVLP